MASTRVVLPVPLGPTRATRSAQSMSSVNGPRRKSPRSITASSRRTTIAPERVASLMLNWSSHPSHGFSTTSSVARARSVRRARDACFSVRLMRKSRCALSLSRGDFFSRATPVGGPLAFALGPLAQIVPLRGIDRIGLLGVGLFCSALGE